MGSVFFVVGPVRGENLVGLAAEQEVEFLLEDSLDLFAARLIEIGHRPAAELEGLGRILGRSAGRLHDAIHGDLRADDDLPHGSLSLFEPTTNVPAGRAPVLKRFARPPPRGDALDGPPAAACCTSSRAGTTSDTRATTATRRSSTLCTAATSPVMAGC